MARKELTLKTGLHMIVVIDKEYSVHFVYTERIKNIVLIYL